MVSGEQQCDHRPERESRDGRGLQSQGRDESGCRVRPVRVTPPSRHVVGGAAPGRIPRDHVDVRAEAFELPGPDPRVLERAVEQHKRRPAPAPPVRDPHPADDDLGHTARVRLGGVESQRHRSSGAAGSFVSHYPMSIVRGWVNLLSADVCRRCRAVESCDKRRVGVQVNVELGPVVGEHTRGACRARTADCHRGRASPTRRRCGWR